jgi:hypothetical protein
VARVGQQGERACEHAADDFGDHETARERSPEPDTTLVGGMRVMMPVAAVTMVVVVVAVVIAVMGVRVVMQHGRSLLASGF